MGRRQKEFSPYRIYIGGVGGVGKTTTGELLAKRTGGQHFAGSYIMMQLCQTPDRESLETYNPDRKEQIERELYPKFIRQYSRISVDGHCRLYEEQAKVFDQFFLLEAEPDKISHRRQNQGRRSTDLEQIIEELKDYKKRITALSSQYRIPLTVIPNNGSVEETVERILQCIRE